MVSGRLNAYAHELAYSKLKIQVLEERLRLQRIEKYGPSSEKLSSLQLELLEQEPGDELPTSSIGLVVSPSDYCC
jgi:hypothetical protein